MGSKKNNRPYDQKNLEYFAQILAYIRDAKKEWGTPTFIDTEELEKAVKKLPRKDRENIERFWGLTGGTNHSKKLKSINTTDVAFIRQSSQATVSLRSLFRIDYMSMYDQNIKRMIKVLTKKINKKGIEMSDLDAIKYLIVFLVILQNGPKMPFEKDPLSIDTECDPNFTFDEYAIIKGAVDELKDIPDGAIRLRLIKDWLDMLDFKDVLAIQKTFCINVPKNEIPLEFRNDEIEALYTFEQTRNFKERVFKYGGWEVVTELILGIENKNVQHDEFTKCLNILRKDWSKVTDFKTGEIRKLRTPHELRNLDVYNIGGLEFTDIYEVMFIYLERNVISTEN